MRKKIIITTIAIISLTAAIAAKKSYTCRKHQ